MDGSMLFAQQAEAFNAQHVALQKSLTQPDRTMTVCEVCGVFINSTDNEQRRKVCTVCDNRDNMVNVAYSLSQQSRRGP